MLIANRWRDFVSDSTLNLLERWIEYYICNQIHSAARLPTEGRRYLFKKDYNRLDQVIYRIEILEGLETSRSTAPKKFTELDEFTFAFRALDKIEQIVILAYIDPFDELKNQQEWKSFLSQNRFKNNAEYDRVLTQAVVRLQRVCERKRLSKIMKQEIRGWDKIAARLNMSIPTAINLAKDPDTQMPITLVGKVAITTEDKLADWLDDRIRNKPYWKLAQEKSYAKRK